VPASTSRSSLSYAVTVKPVKYNVHFGSQRYELPILLEILAAQLGGAQGASVSGAQFGLVGAGGVSRPETSARAKAVEIWGAE